MRQHRSVDRRQFIKTTMAFSAAAALPAASWGRVAGSGQRLNIGVIGTGGRGTQLTRDLVSRGSAENVVVSRVCDVYTRRLNNAMKVIDGAAGSGTMEYREVLDDPEVDAVLIATPDHWHTKIAIEAMEAGKHVFCREAALALTVRAGARRAATPCTAPASTLQVGPQRTSDDLATGRRSEAIRVRAASGQVTWSQGSYCRNSREGQFNWGIAPDAGPKQPRDAEGYVWWDRWLGHEWGLAENIPWNPDHFFRFRKYWAYNGGVATDLLYHKLAPLLLAISGPQGEYPRRVTAAGGQYLENDGRDIPDTFMMMVDYPSKHTVVLVSVMTNGDGIPDVIHGRWGTMNIDDALKISEQGPWSKEFRAANDGAFVHREIEGADGKTELDPPSGKASFDIAAGDRRDHTGNFLDAVRDGAELHCNVELGCSTMVAIKMGVEAYRTGKTLAWDAETESVVS